MVVNFRTVRLVEVRSSCPGIHVNNKKSKVFVQIWLIIHKFTTSQKKKLLMRLASKKPHAK